MQLYQHGKVVHKNDTCAPQTICIGLELWQLCRHILQGTL